MAKPTLSLSNTIAAFQSNFNVLSNNVGDPAQLTTTVDSDIVGAINEVNAVAVAVDSDLSAISTTTVPEGTNLYYTQSRFDTAFSAKSTTNLTEGTNLYHTTARARAAISVTDAGGDGSLSYNSGTGVITYTGPSASEVRAHFSAGSGVSIVDGVITATGATEAARSALSVTDNGGDGSLSYDSSTGIFLYTGPSASEVRAHFSGTSPVTITSGAISVNDATTTTKGIASFATANFAVTSGAVTVKASGITATELASSAVTEAKIGTGAVTNTKLGAGAVTSAKLSSAVTLIIYNSAGTAVKTLYGAGA